MHVQEYVRTVAGIEKTLLSLSVGVKSFLCNFRSDKTLFSTYLTALFGANIWYLDQTSHAQFTA